MTKVGIVGCGKIARTHAAILKKHVGNVELIFCDRHEDRAEPMSRTYGGGPTYRDLDTLLSSREPDAVHILTQVDSHSALARQALTAGAHVYVEKPVTERASDYVELVELAAEHGKLLCAGYSTLGIPVVRRAREIIRSGAFGDLLTVHCDYNLSPAEGIPYGRPDHWAYSLRGGILQNIADHPASLVVDAIGEIADHTVLASRRSRLPNGCADLLHVGVRHERRLGSFTISFGNENTHASAVYSLEGATILIDLRRHVLALVRGRGPQGFVSKIGSGLKLGWSYGTGTVAMAAGRVTGFLKKEPGITGLIQNFYAAIHGDDRLIIEDDAVIRLLRLQEQVWDAVERTAPAQSTPVGSA
jgi:predicted dehydrogenase